MNSLSSRSSELFRRSCKISSNVLDIPTVAPQNLSSFDGLSLIPFSSIVLNRIRCESTRTQTVGVHFFLDDYRFERVYRRPDRYIPALSRFDFVLTPDFSLYCDLPRWRLIESVAHSRWCGNYWQEKGLKVIPTVSWGWPDSFGFCFEGIAPGSTVAVSTLGCRRQEKAFMLGYREMISRLSPCDVLCYGTPFSEMLHLPGTLHIFPYTFQRKEVGHGRTR